MLHSATAQEQLRCDFCLLTEDRNKKGDHENLLVCKDCQAKGKLQSPDGMDSDGMDWASRFYTVKHVIFASLNFREFTIFLIFSNWFGYISAERSS